MIRDVPRALLQASRAPFRRAWWCLRAPYRVQLFLVHRCPAQVGTGEVSAAQVGLGQVEAYQFRSAEVGLAQVYPLQVGILGMPGQIGVGGTHQGPAEVSPTKDSSFEVGTEQYGTGKVGPGEVGSFVVGVRNS
jgi:hypothetical protein